MTLDDAIATLNAREINYGARPLGHRLRGGPSRRGGLFPKVLS